MENRQYGSFFNLISHSFKDVLLPQFSQFALYDIFFKIVSAVILGPIVAWVSRRLLSTAGYQLVSNEQILTFVFSPIGLVVFAVGSASTLAILFAEQAGFIFLASHSMAGRPVKYYQALWHSLKKIGTLFELGLLQIARYTVYLIPCIAIGGIAYVFLASGHDVNYLISERPPSFWVGAVTAVLLAAVTAWIVVVLFVRWIFSVPICMFENKKPADALKESRLLMRNDFLEITSTLAGWGLLAVVSSALILEVLALTSGFILESLGGNLTIIIPVTGILLAIHVLFAAVASFVGFAIFWLLISHFYADIRARNGLPAAIYPEDTGLRAGQASKKRRILWVAALAVLAVASVSSYALIEDMDIGDRVAVTAHRGSSKSAPENSLSAVKRAIADGADFAEIDVQETADGVVVLLHDTDLMRVAALDRKIWEVTYDDIKSLDAGSWFSPDFKGEPIPTLGDVIDAARGKIKLNIELKFNGHEKDLVKRTVDVIKSKNFESECVLTSLNYAGILRVKDLDPELKTGLIVFRAVGNIFDAPSDFYSLSSKIVKGDTIRSANRHDKAIHVWTINDLNTMAYFIELGVDNIITDYPAKLVELLQQRANLSDVERLLLKAGNWIKQ